MFDISSEFFCGFMRLGRRRVGGLWTVVLCLLGGGSLLADEGSSRVSFNRDIRPILSDACFACHGPDGATRKARLRLDTRDGLFEERDGAGVVVSGDADASLLLQRIMTEDSVDLMPPPETGKVLTVEQKELLRRWIEEGAVWEGHWAYQPVRRPAVPEVADSAWSGSAIDRFLYSRMQQRGLHPSPEADRHTLLRRLSFDLTGLPPRPEDVAAFESDLDPDAWGKWVDRMLGSPHYGERMALYWLDLVRYADTDGFHADNYRSVWPYRDYVIRAFNENKPFDRFTLEQVAGDLLSGATLETRVASTYNRLGRSTEEGGSQPKEYLAKYAAERVRSVGTVWLGSTTGCAECHDHKFDPYTMEDFYRLAAYFADIEEQGVGTRKGSLVPSSEQSEQLAALDRKREVLQQRLAHLEADLQPAFTAWVAALEERMQSGRPAWSVARPLVSKSEGGAKFELQDDGSLLSTGENPKNDTYTFLLPLPEEPVTAVRLEALVHPEFPNRGLSRGNGNFVLTEVEVDWVRADGGEERIQVGRAEADFEQSGWPASALIDGKANTGWAVSGHEKPADHRVILHLNRPLPVGPAGMLRVRLRHESDYAQHNVGRLRLALSGMDHPSLDARGVPPEILEALHVGQGDRTPEQVAALEQRFLAASPILDGARAELVQVVAEREALVKVIPTTLMTTTTEPRVTRMLPRGNWMDDSGDVVRPAPPAFIRNRDGSGDGVRQSRVELGRWLGSRDNPLTARVFVNRLWRLFFGVGLSKNVTDFGSQGEWPKHPELLDWLAAEFMDSGWDVKHIVRLMVSSAAYRQASGASPELREKDPFNRWVARQARVRLDAEVIRDNALAVSGLLSGDVGGASVKPYQPAGYWDHLNFPKRTWQADSGDQIYRRGLYVFWCRTFLHPGLLSFDACPREESTAERVMSNTPLQALTLLNDPVYVEAARVLAERVVREGGSTVSDRIEWVYRQVLARRPQAGEQEVMEALVDSERQRFGNDAEAVKELLSVGARLPDAALNPVEVAAWTAVTRTLLNLDETVVRN